MCKRVRMRGERKFLRVIVYIIDSLFLLSSNGLTYCVLSYTIATLRTTLISVTKFLFSRISYLRFWRNVPTTLFVLERKTLDGYSSNRRHVMSIGSAELNVTFRR